MNNSSNVIGVDLGGTQIRIGKVENNCITKFYKTNTPSKASKLQLIDTLISSIKMCIDEGTKSIGIGVPSVVDTKNGIVYNVVNIPSWDEVKLGGILQDEFHLPVYLNNDANCFAVSEKIYGEARHFNDCAAITIGTGLGLGLILDGKLYEGRNCGAGEFGMLPYLDQNYEAFCSGNFFAAYKGITGLEAFNLASKGEVRAIEMFNEFGFHMASLLKSIMYAYDPEIIVLGGSLSKAYQFFKNTLHQGISDFAYPGSLKNLKLEVSKLDKSAIFGAGALSVITKH